MPCAGYIAVAIPLTFIALCIGVIFTAEYLRRRRTASKDDNWFEFGGDASDDKA